MRPGDFLGPMVDKRHEEVVLCIVCQRERPPKGQMYCEDCWQKARKRMKDEEDA